MKKLFTASILTVLFLAGCQASVPKDGKYAQLAQCLTEKEVKMYGAFWCPHCANQKKMFGDDFRYITYVECDPRGENADVEACQKAGVSHYPTWVFPGQDNIVGEQQPEELAQKANCDATPATGDQAATSTESQPSPETVTNGQPSSAAQPAGEESAPSETTTPETSEAGA